MSKKSFLVAIILLLTSAYIGQCSDYFIDALNGSDDNNGVSSENAWKTITHALSNVESSENDPAVIHVASGTYTEESGEIFPIKLEMRNYISLIGENKDTTIIRTSSSKTELFNMDSVNNCAIKSFTFIGVIESEESTIAISCSQSSPVIENCLFTKNAGISCSESSPIFENCQFKECISNWGIIILFNYSCPKINNCIIENNRSGDGWDVDCSGISCISYSSPVISNCIIRGNNSKGPAGGIFCSNKSSPTVINTEISGNTADGSGGGINCYDSSITLANCIIADNFSEHSGGAIYFQGTSKQLEDSIRITDCTFIGNESKKSGGAIYANDSIIEILGTDLHDNICGDPDYPNQQSFGGAINLHNSDVTISKSKINNNTILFGDGSGINCSNSNLKITDTEISNNRMENIKCFGGGIFCEGTSFEFSKCLINMNSARNGGGAYFESSDGTISECNFNGNEGHLGGGLFLGNSQIFVKDSILQNNTASKSDTGGSFGGGIFSEAASILSISDSRFIKNSSDNFGGALCSIDNSTLYLSDNEITKNRSGSGGGIYCVSSTGYVENNLINLNTAFNGSGGGIRFEDSSPNLTGCEITANTATESGSGIYCYYSSPLINNCSIHGNIAGSQNNSNSTDSYELDSKGGGFCCEYFSSPLIINSELTANNADLGGAIFCGTFCLPKVFNCLFSRNSSFEGAGFYSCDFSTLRLTNATFADNVSQITGTIFSEIGCQTTILNSILWNNGIDPISGEILISYSDIDGGYQGIGNIDLDPAFVSGPRGDYYLSQIQAGQTLDSSCINTGYMETTDNGVNVATTRTDGFFDNDNIDMGYHYQPHIKFNLRIEPFKASYGSNDSIKILLDLDKVAPPSNIDIYLIMIEPNGIIFSGMDWSEDLKPALSSILLPSDISLKDIVIFENSIPVMEPPINTDTPGIYRLAIAAFISGSNELISNVEILSFELKQEGYQPITSK
jgi:predicted outer membrane repeat protein